MPVLAECRDVVEGIASGNFKKLAINGGIIAMSSGQSHMKINSRSLDKVASVAELSKFRV
jgi:hypothetical protein